MIIKDRNGWIAVVFLVFIFLIPVATLLGFTSSEEVLMVGANQVLTGNGTLAGDDTTKENMNNGTQEQSAEAGADVSGAGTGLTQFLTGMQNTLTGFTERLFLKKAFISANSSLTAALTGGTYMESTRVLLGKEDWLFYKTEDDGSPIHDYMGINHFTEEELAAMANNLILTRDYFEKEKGITFIATTIPNKEMIYEEYMPDTIARVNTVSRGEQFANYIWENTDIAYVYPKQAFLEQKEKYPLFYKTDTHWNTIGAFVGVQELFEELYGQKASPDSVTFNVVQEDFAGDLSVIADISEQYGIDTLYEFDPESADPEQKRDETVIIVGDSFGGFLSAIADGYYNEVYRIDTEDFTVSMVDEYGADVVIWETVERLQETFMTDSLLD